MKTFLYTAILASVSFTQLKGEAVTFIDARDQLGAIENYIESREKNLAIQGKAYDMFGLPQDLKKAQSRQQNTRVAAARPKLEIPLQKIVDALPVTMIDPMGDRVVLSGVPPLSKGETLELTYQGETVLLRFEGSRSDGAYFRDMKSKKLGLRKMTRLPKGIKKGSDRALIAGGIHKESSDKSKNIKLDLNFPGGPGLD